MAALGLVYILCCVAFVSGVSLVLYMYIVSHVYIYTCTCTCTCYSYTPSLLSAGRVIGKRGHVIQQILEKSRVHNIRVMGDEESTDKTDPSGDVPFDFVGRRAAVENAVLMLNYHLDHLKVGRDGEM